MGAAAPGKWLEIDAAQGDNDPRWQIAVSASDQGLWEFSGLHNSPKHTDGWFALRGLDPDDKTAAEPDCWLARVHPEDQHMFTSNIFNQATSADENFCCVYRERHKLGHWVWIKSQGKVVRRNQEGQVVCRVGLDTDISTLKHAEAQVLLLTDSEKRWRTAVESAGQGLWDVNNFTHKNYYSDMWRAMRGLSVEDSITPIQSTWFDSVHPEDRVRLQREFAELECGTTDIVNHEYRHRSKSGEWVWIMSRGKIVERDASGKTVRVIGTDTDITALKTSEAALKRLTHRYGLAVSTAKVGVWEYDLAKQTPLWDDNTRELFGVTDPDEELPKDIWDQRIHPDDRARALSISGNAVLNRCSYAMDYRIVIPSGEVRHVRCRAVYYEDIANGPRLVGVNWDVTQDHVIAADLQRAKELAEKRSQELEAAHKSLEHNALHDALTGLPNRRQLDHALLAVDEAVTTEGRVAVLHIDLDRFKEINDTLGHVAGDAILKRAAAILTEHIGHLGLVCRSGGDEFVVVIWSAPDNEDLATLANLLLSDLNEPVIYDGHEVLFGASIGIAVQDMIPASGRNLLINADLALYRAKSDGRNRFSFFTSDMEQQATATKKCADDIRRGIERKEFFPVYQLQFDGRTQEIIGVEALARWRHPERGVLTPDAFLQIAEDISAVARIDEMILEQALDHLAQWRQQGLCIPHVSVNISARRLGDFRLIEGLRKLDIPSGSLSFELLESIYLDNQNEIVAKNLSELRTLGIGIEIDDFGTGHASIACLLSLRPKRLKIDRVLVQPIVVSVESRRLLASIVDIGQALGIEVLAEGVETQEHVRALTSLDCFCLQGYALALPMDALSLESFVIEEKWKLAA